MSCRVGWMPGRLPGAGIHTDGMMRSQAGWHWVVVRGEAPSMPAGGTVARSACREGGLQWRAAVRSLAGEVGEVPMAADVVKQAARARPLAVSAGIPILESKPTVQNALARRMRTFPRAMSLYRKLGGASRSQAAAGRVSWASGRGDDWSFMPSGG
jgi:hypothetical protein